jgi:preprotein translocase subunit SecG
MGDSAPDGYLAVVLTIVIVVAVVLVLVAGFWWTRGSGPGAGSIFSPGRQELTKYTRLGGRMPEPGEDVDRERE